MDNMHVFEKIEKLTLDLSVSSLETDYINHLSFNLGQTTLITIAETCPDDKLANEAMKILREEYDPTYIWCTECGGVVCKEKDCCMNKNQTSNENNLEISF